MKKIASFLIVALFLVCNSIAQAQNDKITFEWKGESNKSIAVGIPDKSVTVNWGDGNIDTYSSDSEHFPISHSYNDTENYEVTISATSLFSMECNSSQIVALDVSNAPDLYSLLCHSNQLSSLDVSKNTELTFLDCSRSQLSSLDVSNNAALTILYCGSTSLSSLNISKDTNLLHLTIYATQIASLDVSKHVELESLMCSNTQLTSLDVSKNTKLTTLGCDNCFLRELILTNNVALIELYCSYNQLTSLVISNNTNLSKLNCTGNQLPLDELYQIVNNGAENKDDFFYISPQTLPEKTAKVGEMIDIPIIDGTISDLSGGSSTDYTYNNGKLIFLNPGNYSILMSNSRINDSNGSAKVLVNYTVSSGDLQSDFTIENGVLVKYNGAGGDVVIPDGVTPIGATVFKANTALSSVTIPNSVTNIEMSAFNGCSGLTSLTIPGSVTNIEGFAFAYCTSLTEVTVEWEAPLAAIDLDAFYGTSMNSCKLFVPAGAKSLYKDADVWKDFKTILEEGEEPSDLLASGTTSTGLTWTLDKEGLLTISGEGEMPDYLYESTEDWRSYKEEIVEVNIEEGVTVIGNYSFYPKMSIRTI